MAFGVVLDTCVLYPLSIADILMRLAERELYDLYWSEGILQELERVMEEKGASAEQASHRVDAMRRTFEAAMVSAEAIARLEPAMTNDKGDRHVLAAAVACGADAVVTANLKHFPPESCDPHGIDAIHPDDFLVTLYDLDPGTVQRTVIAQAAALRRPVGGQKSIQFRRQACRAAIGPSAAANRRPSSPGLAERAFADGGHEKGLTHRICVRLKGPTAMAAI